MFRTKKCLEQKKMFRTTIQTKDECFLENLEIKNI